VPEIGAYTLLYSKTDNGYSGFSHAFLQVGNIIGKSPFYVPQKSHLYIRYKAELY
jgi:hypothetical protein